MDDQKPKGGAPPRHGYRSRLQTSPWGTPEYRCWHNMRQRCRNPNNKDYHHYGGRGITICERWDNFENFLADMGLKPDPSFSIERKDNEKGYCPGNCYWATRFEQRRNRRRQKNQKPQ